MGNGIPHGKSRGGRVLNVFSDFSITFVFKVSFLNGDFFFKDHFVSVTVNVKGWYLSLQK